MKLQPMTDFVLEQRENFFNPNSANSSTYISIIFNYAKFLKQPLKLEMFVPCDDDGNVLEEPNDYKYFIQDSEFGGYDGEQEEKCEAYLKAKEKVLFKGFEICDRNDKVICVVYKDEHFYFKHLGKTIESLAKHYLELTENAVKQFKL